MPSANARISTLVALHTRLDHLGDIDRFRQGADDRYRSEVRKERLPHGEQYIVCAVGDGVDSLELTSRPRLLRWTSDYDGAVVSLWGFKNLDQARSLFRQLVKAEEGITSWLSLSTFYRDD